MDTARRSADPTDAPTRRGSTAGLVLAGICLLLGPVLLGIGLALHVSPWDGPLPAYDRIAAHGARMAVAANLALLAVPLLLGAAAAIAVAARRAATLASAGLACTFAGLTAMTVNAMLSYPLTLMGGIDDRGGLADLAAALDHPLPVVAYLFPLYLVGTVLLAVALHRSDAVPRWAAVAVGIGGLVPVAQVIGVGALALVLAVIRVVGSVPVVASLARDAHPTA